VHPETSIREFLDSCEAKRVPDKITAIGKYLKIHNNQMDFDKNDLISNFESAAEPVPKNIARDLKWTLKACWIALKSGSKDRYYVTNSGKTAVEQKFSKAVVKKTRGLMPGGSKKPSAAQDSEV
jgi:fibronectin type 3 domain-containing protein